MQALDGPLYPFIYRNNSAMILKFLANTIASVQSTTRPTCDPQVLGSNQVGEGGLELAVRGILAK